MASPTESRVINAAGLVQGIVLVTFPAASTILTDPDEYNLTSTQYGVLFLPQVITAITGALLGSTLARRLGTKTVYLFGLGASLAAMLLLVASAPMAGDSLAFAMLLLATGLVGVGFGLTVPSLNTFTASFHPDRIDNSVLVLNALLGLGTALAPVFVAVFVGLGFWWGLPVLSAALLAGLLAVSLPLALRDENGATPAHDDAAGSTPRPRLPSCFWLFASFAVLYGFCETMNGNWAQLDMTTELHASTTLAAVALTAFWSMVTVGRVVFAAVQRQLPTSLTYRILPFVLAGAVALVAVLPSGAGAAGVLAFGLAGLGCSALLPLTISFGQEQLVTMSSAVAGGVIACYQVGYGIAAFGTGPLQSAGVSLSTLFALTAGVALVMAGCSFAITASRSAKLPLIPETTPGATS